MVQQSQFQSRLRVSALSRFSVIGYYRVSTLALVLGFALFGYRALGGADGLQELGDAKQLYQQGQYFMAARYAFAAIEDNPDLRTEAYPWVAISLIRAGLYNSSSYFFIKSLQTGNPAAVRTVLKEAESLLVHVGGDLLRKYLILHTKYEDYDRRNLSAYLYALGKEALLTGKEAQSIGYFNAIRSESPIWPVALQLRGIAHAIIGENQRALHDFQDCADNADQLSKDISDSIHKKRMLREEGDLEARCIAGEARTLYQMEQFEEADRVYDRIPKRSIVWPDILFEQAWNSFSKQEYNRALGKLVSYKSPALNFIFNSEIDVLRAQSYLALCLYSDANNVINEFNSNYTKLGEDVKDFVESKANDLYEFYNLGAEVLKESIYTRNNLHKLVNRFIRGPYFQNLLSSVREVNEERSAIRLFDSRQTGVRHDIGSGFPGFLEQVLKWRIKSIQLLGGSFVKNSLMDYHQSLLLDYDKMAFIKLEMLKRAKDLLIYKNSTPVDRTRGNIVPSRRDDQYYWSFNGEFWNDELGDYVFGLESKCGTGKENE